MSYLPYYLRELIDLTLSLLPPRQLFFLSDDHKAYYVIMFLIMK